MENRYKLMSSEGVKNIDGYNEKHKLKMPYIVVVVDEMSDLMLVSGKEIESIPNGQNTAPHWLCWQVSSEPFLLLQIQIQKIA